MSKIFDSFINTSCETFGLLKSDLDTVTPNMISPFVLELPKTILEQVQNIVSDLHKLVQNENYKKQVASEVQGLDVSQSPLTPLLCSLDVHVAADNVVKIIEINTNASSYLINVINNKMRNMNVTFPHALEDLAMNFATTIAQGVDREQILVIMDEKPESQKLYIEFLMYKKFLEQNFSVKCEILDPSQMETDKDGALTFQNKKIFGIYNRHTDFFLKTLPHVLKAHNSQKVLLSPHPWGYAMLADKNRMTDLQNPEWNKEISLIDYPALKKALLKTKPFSQFASVDELWQQRHHNFFKPAESYGSKSVYAGKSISRKKFDEIYKPDMLAQEAAPAPEVVFDNEGTPEKFKYDLRFFFFEGKVQLGFARTYRGQLTNLQTPLGGHAPLVFS